LCCRGRRYWSKYFKATVVQRSHKIRTVPTTSPLFSVGRGPPPPWTLILLFVPSESQQICQSQHAPISRIFLLHRYSKANVALLENKLNNILKPPFFNEATKSSLSVGKVFYVNFTTRTKKYKKRTPSAEYLKKNLSIDTNFDPC
jgi:hypothetical protein